MSKLAAAIEAANSTPRYAQCSIAKLLTGALSRGDAEDLRAALANPAIPGAAIAKGLEAVGHQVSGLTVQRHRRRQCRCPR